MLGAIDRRVRRVGGPCEDAAAQKMHSPSLGPVTYSMRQGAHSGRSVMTGQRTGARHASLSLVFHVELRQFPHQTRAFNLTREELDARIVGPWIAGEAIELNEYRWLPDRATLTIYEGPLLGVADMGLGRGWQNVTRKGREVTQEVLIEARDETQRAADGRGLQGRGRRAGRRRRDLRSPGSWSSPASGIRSRG